MKLTFVKIRYWSKLQCGINSNAIEYFQPFYEGKERTKLYTPHSYYQSPLEDQVKQQVMPHFPCIIQKKKIEKKHKRHEETQM